MSRKLNPALVFFVLFVVLSGWNSFLLAQSRNNQPASRRSRPQGQTLRIEKPSPELMRALENWYRGTSQIKTLEGYHSKYTYNEVFAVEKRGIGRFYYETPDKGRIQIVPAKIPPGAKAARRARKPPFRRFALQADRAVEWACDGHMIYRIDPINKKGEYFKIPPKGQGRNIMEGPLPFLLGMPPQKALQRYKLKLLKDTKTEVWLDVIPRWKQDMAQYKQATIILQKDNYYLPSAVKLIDPTENLETVYTFYKTSVNKKPFLFPRQTIPEYIETLKGKFVFETPGGASSGSRNQSGRAKVPLRPNPMKTASLPGVIMPDLLGLKHADAVKKLKALGFQVKLHKGSVAKRAELLYRVQNQIPKPNSQIKRGSLVHLQLFVKAADLQKRTAAKPN
ncbi:MAG: hypothetical protein Tsb009_38690 [Planctomycetaceae bacterium]